MTRSVTLRLSASPLARYSCLTPHSAARVTTSESFTFGPFRLDQRAARPTRGGEIVALRPKTWAVLLHLVERAGALVTRDELLDAIGRDVAVTPSARPP